MINRKRFVYFLSFFLMLFVFFTSNIFAKDIIVNPGKFDRFIITLPENIQAGDEVQINIQAADNLGNIIKNFNTYEKEFIISTTGSATLNTKSLKASAFSNGFATVIFRNTVAEKVVLSIREANNLIPLITKDIIVTPASLKSFTIKSPKTSRAGEKFDITIIAKDAFGNTYTEPILGKNINFSYKGEADVKFDMSMVPDIIKGSTVATFMAMKTGLITIEAKDVITGSSGVSEPIEIINGNVNSFKVMAPKEAVAGEPFEISIAAIDRFGNFVTDYSSNGKGINIKSLGKTVPFPSTVPAYEFSNGQAKISIRYDISETVILNVVEIGGTQSGSSEAITVTLPKADRFEIVTPESVIAGQKFKVKITVYNQNNKVIKNYNLIGSDVILKASGTGNLIPDRIPASEFVNGTAVIDVQYNKAEAFKITAQVADQKTDKPVTEKIVADTKKDTQTTKQTHATKVTDAQKTQKISKKPTKKYEITNLSIVESKNTSTLTVHINGMNDAISYSVLSEKGNSNKKYLILKIKSAVSKIDKNFTLDSNYIKNVVIEEEQKADNVVLIKMEQIKPAKFHVTKGKGAISLVFKK
ncbi:MAG: hypothetical protein N2738_01050 [Thermodesulfovibrionales bacterium]|nr:hypothetical protein [Thermodesulfovibrionales bacterium]